MNTPSLKSRASERASALVMALFIIAVLATLLGVAFDFTSNTSIQARRSQELTAEQSMAEGALEAAFVVWKNYMTSKQNLPIDDYTDSSDFVTLVSPLVTKFNTTIASTNYVLSGLVIEAVDRADNPLSDGQSTSTWTLSPSAVPGWIGTSYTYRARATVAKWLNKTASTKDPSSVFTVERYFQTTDCSLFQAMMFFQNDLELNVGYTNMTISGLVATNSNLYLSSHSALTFNNNVSFHGNAASFNPATKHPANAIYDSTGYAEGVTQRLYTQEGTWDAFNNPVYPSGKSSQLSPNVPTLDPLGMASDLAIDTSNPNTTGTHEIIERPVPVSKTNPNMKTGSNDPVTYAAHRLYNSAGLRIFINRSSSTPVSVYTPSTTNVANSVAANAALATSIASAITPDTSTGAIYDFRETSKINASTVDMSKLTPILNSYPDFNGVVYIQDVTNMDANGESGNTDAIRIKKGGMLPNSGLTLVSDGAVYVQGDYNTGTTYKTDGTVNTQPAANTSGDSSKYTVTGYTAKPAAVIGDAVMMLSNSWQDANSSKTIGYRNASPTTFNAALVTGQKLTTSDAASGGAHNLPRFLEDWGGTNFTYHGSMVELYESKHFKGDWGTQAANIYGPPSRPWYFDTSFLTAPPPGNLRSTTYTADVGRGLNLNASLRMKKVLLMAARAMFLVAAPSAPALDFTLSTKTIQEDGYPREVSYFAWNAGTTVAIQAPPKWKLLTTPAVMTMVSASMPGGEVRLEKSPFAPGMQFKEPELTRYREHALAQAPAGATEVRLTDEKEDPLPIFEWTDRDYVIEYSLYGEKYKRSVLFLNVDATTQLRVTAVAPPAEFDRVHKAAYSLLHTWQPAAVTPPPPR